MDDDEGVLRKIDREKKCMELIEFSENEISKTNLKTDEI